MTDPTPPWEYDEVDRGYETACWIVRAKNKTGIHPRAGLTNWFSRFLLRGEKGVFQHLCEQWGEVNCCARLSHIVVGTQSSNAKHWHQLRREAGVGFYHMRGQRRVLKTRQCEVCKRVISLVNFERHKCK
jgi:hypothetical protein